MDFWKPYNLVLSETGFFSRKIWYCEMNVGTYRGILNVTLCIFALSMQVAAVWSHNLSCSLDRKKHWDVLIWFNMNSTRNWILKCQLKWFKNVTFLQILHFGEFMTNGLIVQDQWFDSYIHVIIVVVGASSVDCWTQLLLPVNFLAYSLVGVN